MHAFWGAQSPFFGIWPCHLLMGQIYGLIGRVFSQDVLLNDAGMCFLFTWTHIVGGKYL